MRYEAKGLFSNYCFGTVKFQHCAIHLRKSPTGFVLTSKGQINNYQNHLMKQFVILTLLLTVQMTCSAIPRLFQQKEFTAASFAEAINYYVDLGEVAAVNELQNLAENSSRSFRGSFDINERIGWICRVLFEPKSGSLPPLTGGALLLPYHTMPAKSWPLFPVALSGSTYFVLSEGNLMDEFWDKSTYFINFSRNNGVFIKTRVRVPTKLQALEDAARLRQSEAWQAIVWRNERKPYQISEGTTFVWGFADSEFSEEKASRWIQLQAEGIQ